MNKYLITGVLMLCFACASFGQTLPSLIVSSDSRSFSLGGASVGGGILKDGESGRSGMGAFALENNVAGMSLDSGKLNAAVSFGMWQPEYASDKFIGVGATGRITDKWAVGVLFKYMMQPEYQTVTDSGNDVRDSFFSPKEFNVGVGVSYAIINCLSAGIGLKVTDSVLGPETSAIVFGADIGLYFNRKGISAGLSVNNLGNKVRYGERSYDQPMLAKLGAGYSAAFGISSLSVSAETDILFSGAATAGAGVEYGLKDMAFIRAGYHYGNSPKTVPSYASAGIGLKLWGVTLDASYIFGSKVLKNSVSISLGYKF
ncbi:MAG: PorV/PorQ family protein [Candidatus Cryptobacteroides sp.]